MAKVTSKLQVTVPKAVAERYGIRPGDDIVWVPAGDSIRVEAAKRKAPFSTEARLRLFDQASARIAKRSSVEGQASSNRGWRREDLYRRGRAD